MATLDVENMLTSRQERVALDACARFTGVAKAMAAFAGRPVDDEQFGVWLESQLPHGPMTKAEGAALVAAVARKALEILGQSN